MRKWNVLNTGRTYYLIPPYNPDDIMIRLFRAKGTLENVICRYYAFLGYLEPMTLKKLCKVDRECLECYKARFYIKQFIEDCLNE